MARSLRIVVADDDSTVLESFSRMLRQLGHQVVASVNGGQALVEQAKAHAPDVVISDIKMDDLDGIEAAREICNHGPIPIIFVSGYSDTELIERAQGDYVLAYLVKPVRKADLEAAITIAMGRFAEFQILRMEADHYRQTLAHRKIIERAKGILMKKAHMPEADAFARLQTLAREKKRKLVEIAEMIVTADEVLDSSRPEQVRSLVNTLPPSFPMIDTNSSRKYGIITGAASGLGRALAIELARAGWHIAVADLNDAGSAETLELVRKAGGEGQIEHLDVTSPDAWRALREKLEPTWPRLDLLVNNAGVGCGGEVGQLPLDDWKWIININLYGAIYGCHTLIDWMKQNRQGAHIVNIASLAAVASAPGMAPYNITKAGMLSLSETLYGELKPHNIGVTGVCPAFFPTNIIRNGRFQSAGQQKIAQRLMSQSKATAEEVAQRIVHAIENRQLYVFVPAISGIFWRLKRLMPVLFLKFIASRNSGEGKAVAKDSAGTPEVSSAAKG